MQPGKSDTISEPIQPPAGDCREQHLPRGTGGSDSSPLPKIKRTAHLRTVMRVDPRVGIGVYTESAKVQRLLESAGLGNRHNPPDKAAYFLVPPDRHELVAELVRLVFTKAK